MTQTSLDSKCDLVVHSNDIHELVVRTFNTAGADAYVEQIETIYRQRRSTDPLLLLLSNFAGGSLPMNYTFDKSKLLNLKYRAIGPIRHAMLIEDPVSARLMESFTRLMRLPPGQKVKVFEAAKREAAIAWLLEN